jgi:DNA-binding protein H-NS
VRLRFGVFLSDAKSPIRKFNHLDGERAAMALKTMSVAKLQALKSQLEAAISAKVTERRRELESELSRLAGFTGGRKATKFGRTGRMGPVAPKYRNPENSAETWAGRGLKPRLAHCSDQRRQKARGFCYRSRHGSVKSKWPQKGR